MEKLYYSIGEVADMFNVNPSLIRYWENEFTLLSPKKNKKGDRLFTKEDIGIIRMIYHLLKEKGYTIEGARKRLKEDKVELKLKSDVIQKLQRIRSDLLDLNESL